jgi:hypothetical protein
MGAHSHASVRGADRGARRRGEQEQRTRSQDFSILLHISSTIAEARILSSTVGVGAGVNNALARERRPGARLLTGK